MKLLFLKQGLLFLFLVAPVTSIADEWFLMARHGECADIMTLKRKIPKLDTVATPDEFSDFMTRNGYAVETRVMEGTDGNLVSVKVAKKGLYLVFSKKTLCREFVGIK